MKNILRYLLKEFVSGIFFLAGGVRLLRKIYSGRSVFVVLNYHNFSKYNNFRIRRGPILESGYADSFEKQIRFLKKYFSFSSPDEFFGSDAPKGINILLTFDDGYKDNFEIAFPVLKRHNIPAIFFITTGYTGTGEYLIHDKIRYLVPAKLLPERYIILPVEINKGKRNYSDEDIKLINKRFNSANVTTRIMMNKKEIAELYNNGFIIGNHSHTHARLSFLPAEEQEKEILQSNDMIEEITGKRVRYFAYPNGLANSETYDILKKAGIEYGFKMTGGENFINSSRYDLNRIGMNASDSVSFLLLKMFFHTVLKSRPYIMKLASMFSFLC